MTLGNSIIDRSPFPMATTDGPAHLVRRANTAFGAIHGMQVQDMLGYPVSKAIPVHIAASVTAVLDSVYLSDRSASVSSLRIDDPKHRLVLRSYTAWAVPASKDSSYGLVIQVCDSDEETVAGRVAEEAQEEMREVNSRLLISSVKQHELATMASEAEHRLRDIVNGVNAIVCEVDAQSGRFTFVSDQAQSLLGYSIDRWNEPDFWKQVIHPEYYEQTMRGFLGATSGEGDDELDFRADTADGSEMWLRNIVRVVRDAKGTVAKLRTVMVDVTEQQRARAMLLRAFDRERAIAAALQYTVTWEEPEDIFAGLAVSTIYEPASSEALVGGDFFDAISLPNGHVLLVVGDVTGKGLKAAARTVEVKYALRAFMEGGGQLEDAVARLNDFICRHHGVTALDHAELIVLLVAVINPVDGLVRFLSGGAEPPFIVHASGEVEEVPVRGLMLGVNTGTVYQQMERSLGSGDVLILTTDGITEARRGLDFFGFDRIAQIVRHADPTTSMHDLGKSIVEAARAFATGQFQDDVCILLLRRN